jgi:hypothetical protein
VRARWSCVLAVVSCIGVVLGAACTTAVPVSSPSPQSGDTVSGTVLDQDGPVSGATVRVQATNNATATAADGTFSLAGLTQGVTVTISAWKDAYYCAKVEGVVPPTSGLTLSLRRYQTNDNPAYEWIPPAGENSCASCKAGVTEIWSENDAHAGSATNPRFLSMYNGTDLEGNQSPLTRRASSRDYGSFPLRPDLTQPYYGPGYKLDFPDTAGNCASCHTPGAAVDAAYETDPNTVSGADTYGVHCDMCHKVADVKLSPDTGLPQPNMPGVLSLDIRRPFPDDPDRYQLFFGTFDDDNVPEEDTYLPLTKQSEFCAPCHFGVFWDTVVYNSFGEWLESPYSDPQTGRTCQQCHMPAPSALDGDTMTNVAPGKGGVEREPQTIHTHLGLGATPEVFLQNAVAMTTSATVEGTTIVVEVKITNDQTGHHVPSDFPGRHLILLVQATESDGNPLSQLGGPQVPEWAGIGDPAEGCYAGLPGKAFAQVLEETCTEMSPSAAYWNPTRVLSDNRLGAFATDSSAYTFAAPEQGEVTVEVTLLYRRAFIELMDQKGWDVPDIVMERQIVRVSAGDH